MMARGFTLIELVIAIAISSIVVVFVAMFMQAPLDAYQAHSQRTVLVADAAGAWPRMETDLRSALPNSLRARRNGNIVAIEMLAVVDVARYKSSPSTGAFVTAGTFRGIALPWSSTTHYLFMNSLGGNPYAPGGSMTPAGQTLQIAAAAAGENSVSVIPAHAFPPGDSPRHRIYLLSGPVTWLCDETQGTLRRYAGYTPSSNQTARDTAAELNAAGASSTLISQGLTSCNFAASPLSAVQSQTAAVRLTTTRNGDVVTLLHSSHAEYLP